MSAKKLNFQYGYEVRDVSPLPHYYEEIISHTKQLKQIGLRGDRNYLFHSKDGLGTAYYEEAEIQLSAEHTYKYFSDPKNRRKFFAEIDELLLRVNARLKALAAVKISSLPDEELYKLYAELMELDGWAFTYFLATQPYKTRLFEDEVKTELQKKVAAGRVDEYMTELALSEKPTRLSDEEKDWLAIIIEARKAAPDSAVDTKHLKQKHPKLYKQVYSHYQKYGILSLGDGVWKHSVDYFIDNLSRDYGRPMRDLQERYGKIKNFPKNTLRRRQELINDLYLEPDTIDTIEFLADIGRYRFMLRTDGWMPVIHACLVALREIEPRLGIKGDELMYFRDGQELADFYAEPSKDRIAELKRRIFRNKEFLLLLLDGKYHAYFGAEAAAVFKKYVTTVDVSKDSEVRGSVAMRGKVRSTATVYMWGDNLDQKLKEIKKHPILIAGHTRPAMMPLIRQSIGIVTDEGGITSHAAIVSRELGLPSVINTKIATKVFKTGDRVELDAEAGIVRKL